MRDRLVTQVSYQIDPRQFARAGHSTTDALVYLLHAVYEAVDTRNCGARLLFADYSKGFDMIDHNVLIEELREMHVHPVLVDWIIAFLFNRTQAVRVESAISEWNTLKDGIRQGTKRASSCLRSSQIINCAYGILG